MIIQQSNIEATKFHKFLNIIIMGLSATILGLAASRLLAHYLGHTDDIRFQIIGGGLFFIYGAYSRFSQYNDKA